VARGRYDTHKRKQSGATVTQVKEGNNGRTSRNPHSEVGGVYPKKIRCDLATKTQKGGGAAQHRENRAVSRRANGYARGSSAKLFIWMAMRGKRGNTSFKKKARGKVSGRWVLQNQLRVWRGYLDAVVRIERGGE